MLCFAQRHCKQQKSNSRLEFIGHEVPESRRDSVVDLRSGERCCNGMPFVRLLMDGRPW